MRFWKIRLLQAASVAVLGIFISAGIGGCNEPPPKNLVENPGVEGPFDVNGLPTGWTATTREGTYLYMGVAAAHSGKASLEVGGSAGSIEIQTNPCSVHGGAVIECEGWVQIDSWRDGKTTVYARSPGADDSFVRSTVFEINPNSKAWQRVHFFHGIDQSNTSAMLAVKLSGEALVRIDDLSLKMIPGLTRADLIADKGFESPGKDGTFPEWEFKKSGTEVSYEKSTDSPRSGYNCVRIHGSSGWGVLVTRRQITTRSARLIAQGFVRVKHGKGTLKIDYHRNGYCFASTHSVEGTGEWLLVDVKSDPKLVAKAESISVTLAAGSENGPFVAEFDEVDIFASK